MRVSLKYTLFYSFFFPPCILTREAVLAEMGVALKEDGGTIGVFSPKKVSAVYMLEPGLTSSP